jgi:ribosomal protein L16 Arg81 hydroxylase
MKVSAPPHTDKQDVFVVQTQGAKHWRVFKPPSPSKKSTSDPYARGKGPDALTLEELAPNKKSSQKYSYHALFIFIQ